MKRSTFELGLIAFATKTTSALTYMYSSDLCVRKTFLLDHFISPCQWKITVTKVHMTVYLVYRYKLLITHFKSLVELVSTFGFVPAREGLVISSACTCAACMWIY